MADLERPTRSAASFGPMEVLLTIAHLVLCTAYRMERGGVQLIGLLYSWQIWFHPWEGWLRRGRSEEHTSELQSLMCISYAVFCLKKKNTKKHNIQHK